MLKARNGVRPGQNDQGHSLIFRQQAIVKVCFSKQVHTRMHQNIYSYKLLVCERYSIQ